MVELVETGGVAGATNSGSESLKIKLLDAYDLC